MKFTIRDLFLVTVIVAVLFGWIVDRQNIRQENRRNESQSALEAASLNTEIAGLERQVKMMGQQLEDYRSLPNPSAPAPNPPKP